MTKRRALWIGLGVFVAVLVLAALLTPPPPALGMRFWIRTDGVDDRIYAARNGVAIDGWRWTRANWPTKAKLDLLTARWRSGSARGLARRFGVLPKREGHAIAAIQSPSTPADPWRECLSLNRAWPEDAVVDPGFAGEWVETDGEETARVVFAEDGSITWAKNPGLKWRWGRLGDVVVFGVWHPNERRWSMAGSLVLAPDGKSYRTAVGATGRRVR